MVVLHFVNDNAIQPATTNSAKFLSVLLLELLIICLADEKHRTSRELAFNQVLYLSDGV